MREFFLTQEGTIFSLGYFKVSMQANTWYIENPMNCPLVHALGIVGGKWKPIILHILLSRTHRFGEMKKLIPPVSQKMLSQQLRELEADGIVIRTLFPEVPPKVEYQLSEFGIALCNHLNGMYLWGQEHQKMFGRSEQ